MPDTHCGAELALLFTQPRGFGLRGQLERPGWVARSACGSCIVTKPRVCRLATREDAYGGDRYADLSGSFQLEELGADEVWPYSRSRISLA